MARFILQCPGFEGIRLPYEQSWEDTNHRVDAGGHKSLSLQDRVDLQKDQVKFSIVACDSCNNTSPTTFNKADVIFQFAKGSLATASAGQVEDTIAGLLAIDDSGGDQGNNQGNNNGQQGGNDQGNNQGGAADKRSNKLLRPSRSRLKKGKPPMKLSRQSASRTRKSILAPSRFMFTRTSKSRS